MPLTMPNFGITPDTIRSFMADEEERRRREEEERRRAMNDAVAADDLQQAAPPPGSDMGAGFGQGAPPFGMAPPPMSKPDPFDVTNADLTALFNSTHQQGTGALASPPLPAPPVRPKVLPSWQTPPAPPPPPPQAPTGPNVADLLPPPPGGMDQTLDGEVPTEHYRPAGGFIDFGDAPGNGIMPGRAGFYEAPGGVNVNVGGDDPRLADAMGADDFLANVNAPNVAVTPEAMGYESERELIERGFADAMADLEASGHAGEPGWLPDVRSGHRRFDPNVAKELIKAQADAEQQALDNTMKKDAAILAQKKYDLDAQKEAREAKKDARTEAFQPTATVIKGNSKTAPYTMLVTRYEGDKGVKQGVSKKVGEWATNLDTFVDELEKRAPTIDYARPWRADKKSTSKEAALAGLNAFLGSIPKDLLRGNEGMRDLANEYLIRAGGKPIEPLGAESPAAGTAAAPKAKAAPTLSTVDAEAPITQEEKAFGKQLRAQGKTPEEIHAAIMARRAGGQ